MLASRNAKSSYAGWVLCVHPGPARCSFRGGPFEASSDAVSVAQSTELHVGSLKHVPPVQNGVHFKSPTQLNNSGHPPGPANCYHFGWTVVAGVFYPQELLWSVRCIGTSPREHRHAQSARCAAGSTVCTARWPGCINSLPKAPAAEPPGRPIPMAHALTWLAHADGVGVPDQ